MKKRACVVEGPGLPSSGASLLLDSTIQCRKEKRWRMVR
jgi:hypothetical protein